MQDETVKVYKTIGVSFKLVSAYLLKFEVGMDDREKFGKYKKKTPGRVLLPKGRKAALRQVKKTLVRETTSATICQ